MLGGGQWGLLLSEGLEWQAPGNMATTQSVLRAAAALPAMGSVVGGHVGKNSLESETKKKAGVVVGGLGWQDTDAQLGWTDGWAQEAVLGLEAVRP